MSRVTKRKHVMKEMLADDFEHPIESQQFARILASRGNNLHEAESPDPTAGSFLVTMPTKFRRNVWIKRGDFVVVQPIDEGDKVKAEIVRILTPQHIKEFTKDGIWPSYFVRVKRDEEPPVQTTCADASGSDSDADDLIQNTNRRQHDQESSDESEDSSADSSEEKASRN